MGNRFIQRIYECSWCGKTPDDGEDMWHMGNEVICKECCDKEEESGDECGGNCKVSTENKDIGGRG